jgi:integrase
VSGERVKLTPLADPLDHSAAKPPDASVGITVFGEAARLYERGYLSRENQLAKPTRDKEKFYLKKYLVPRWGSVPLVHIYPHAVEEWLHTTFKSWWTMHGVRGIMSRIFYYAEGHGLWSGSRPNPAARAKLGKKRYKNERRILSFDETRRVLTRLHEPYLLIIETCIATGARISEILGLKWKHVNFDSATIKIEQRLWRQDLDRPKTEGSRRILGIGNLTPRYRHKARGEAEAPEDFVFQQKRTPGKPLWDSGVRDALHQAAVLEGCDFPGLGPHSFRRANITWRQQVGGSAIEASRIAGHSDLKMTGEYTFVDPARQNELTLRIQRKLRGDIAETPSGGAPTDTVIHFIEKSGGDAAAILGPESEAPSGPITAMRSLRPRERQAAVRQGSKAAAILDLLSQPSGATRSEVMRVTGWEAHSVRGFVSAVVIKKLKRVVESTPTLDGDRLYKILP